MTELRVVDLGLGSLFCHQILAPLISSQVTLRSGDCTHWKKNMVAKFSKLFFISSIFIAPFFLSAIIFLSIYCGYFSNVLIKHLYFNGRVVFRQQSKTLQLQVNATSSKITLYSSLVFDISSIRAWITLSLRVFGYNVSGMYYFLNVSCKPSKYSSTVSSSTVSTVVQ